jgi:hypothetical protein
MSALVGSAKIRGGQIVNIAVFCKPLCPLHVIDLGAFFGYGTQ